MENFVQEGEEHRETEVIALILYHHGFWDVPLKTKINQSKWGIKWFAGDGKGREGRGGDRGRG